MIFYKRFIGDYVGDTAHLSLLEHGVYAILMDRYYLTEKPIPADQAHRIGRAQTEAERTAVDSVLAEFFDLQDGAWRHKRIDAEIDAAQHRIGSARKNGRTGGRKPKKEAANANSNETGSVPVRFDSGFENQTGGAPPVNRQNGAQQSPGETYTKSISKNATESAENPSEAAFCTETERDGNRMETEPVSIRFQSGSENETGLKASHKSEVRSQNKEGLRSISICARASPGELSAALRAKGISSNPSDPRLIAVAGQGVTVATIEAACDHARQTQPDKRLPLAYVLRILEGWSASASMLAVSGASPPAHGAKLQGEALRRHNEAAAEEARRQLFGDGQGGVTIDG